MEGHNVEMSLLGESFDPSLIARIRDDGFDHESRSGSDNFDGVSGEDDQDAADDNIPHHQRSNKKYHRHTPHQIQELETFFKDCPHPDEKQRLELSRRLGLETKQVKFWFQNRRTQMKTQLERHENLMLRQENDKLRAENGMMKEAMANPICNNCGSPAIPGQISFEEHQLRIENARLKEELNRICSLSNKFMGRPISTMALPSSNSGLELAIGRTNNNNNTMAAIGSSFPMGLDMGMTMQAGNDQAQAERSVLIDLALSAMEELMKMAQADGPLWIKILDGDNEVLNLEEYARVFPPCLGPKPPGYVTEATRHTGIVMINSLGLVETLMDPNRWVEMFPSMIARAVPLDVISSGVGGTRSGTLLALEAEMQMLSPLVSVREARMVRLCKQQAENLWAVVDVSVEMGRDTTNAHPFVTCRRLPSGCIVQDMSNGYSKVTWVEHWQYDENVVPQLYRPMVKAGMAFGAHRWIATLQRQCECLAILLSSSMIPTDDHTTLSQGGRRSMVKLAQRMVDNFCSGIISSSSRRWENLHLPTLADDVRIMTRRNEAEPGVPPGVLLCATTSFWLPVSRQGLFDLLRDQSRRFEWDVLSNGSGPVQELAVIAKGQTHANSVSLLRSNGANGNETGMVILQETWTDATASMVVYASVDVQSLNVVMSGGDSSYVALLPSGFVIHPDGPNVGRNGSPGGGGGSLLTVGLQILINSMPTWKLTVESIETVNNVMTAAVQKIKDVVRVAA